MHCWRVRIINCTRGCLIDEFALGAARSTVNVAGAALDVFANEPAIDSLLCGTDNVVATPHLGASTVEAQEEVVLQLAE